ncbi:MAG: M17 family metallopeptidase [Gammaproteobacteria bacterium]
MPNWLTQDTPPNAVALEPVEENRFSDWLEQQDEPTRRWVAATSFQAKAGTFCLMPSPGAELGKVIAGITSRADPWALGDLPINLPPQDYRLEANWTVELIERALVGWALGAYQFTHYRTDPQPRARLAIPPTCNVTAVQNPIEAIYLVRDLINTPADDMMPEQLAEAMARLAREFGGEIKQMVGDELLTNDFPAIHAVGRASQHPPRLIDLRWGDESNPKLTLVGKGVCFDTGGLDLKSAKAMRLMKKDMGGAAHALGLGRLVMAAALPVRLRVLIAAVENAIAGNALHPGDVIRTRQGLTVEIDNTDAEGRLILCDALAESSREQPELVLDFATLTGAARTALGTDIPALFCRQDDVASGLLRSAEREQDPLWRLPLYAPYRALLKSTLADLLNATDSPYAGAITAALFLGEFVPENTPWAHLDLMAFNLTGRPGRPEGGEAMGLRGIFRYLVERFAP